MSDDWPTVDRWFMGEAWIGSQVASHLQVLCDEIGVRWAGTEQERGAAAYVAKQFERLGLESGRIEEFPLRTVDCKGASLAVVGERSRRLDVRPCLFCPTVDVEAPLIDVGFGMPHELDRVGDRLSDAIVLLKIELEPFSAPRPYTTRLNDLARAGAVAAVTAHAQGGRRLAHIAGSDWRNGNPASVAFPLVQTSREDGGLLRRVAATGGRVRLTVDSQARMTTSWNAMAELRGSTLPEEYIVIGAHHDTTPDSYGANDDGTGVAVLLETARLLAGAPAATGVPLPRTLRFVTFGAEEQGLQGSEAYVERHHGSEPLPRLMFNLDELGTGPVKGVVLQFPELRGLMQQQLDALQEGFQCHVLEQLDASGDMFPFTSRGVPTAFFWRWRFVGKHPDSTFGHGSSDTLEKLRLRELKEYAGTLARLLARLASLPAEQWPEGRIDPREIARRLDAERDSVFRTM
jgi:hypothetical protein